MPPLRRRLYPDRGFVTLCLYTKDGTHSLANSTRVPDIVSQPLTDRMISALDVHDHDVSRRHTIQLTADFTNELQRLSAEYLLQETAARFGHWDQVLLQQIIQFATDELGVWARRPNLPRQSTIDVPCTLR